MPESASLRTAALVLFCRRPLPGSGKQRLVRDLGEENSLAVARALLECALEDAAAWPGRLVVSPACGADAAWAKGLLPRLKWVIPQPKGNLGQRINAVDAAVRRRHCGRVLIIGSDAPCMQPGDLEAAAATLEHADVALIPAADGGVTLMGSRVQWPQLSSLPWSESALGCALERCCQAAGLSVARLSASFDIDQVADFRLAFEALARDPRPARQRLNELLTALTCPPAARASPPGGPGESTA
jgi:hypothetical protein